MKSLVGFRGNAPDAKQNSGNVHNMYLFIFSKSSCKLMGFAM